MTDELSTELFGLTFKNPIWLGSSDATRLENMDRAIESGAGAVVMKSVTELADFQNKSITRYLVLNDKDKPSKGLTGDVYSFFSRGGPMQSINQVINKMPHWRKKADEHNTKIFGSVSAGTLEGWENLSTELAASGVDGIELNFGNPHAKFSDKDMGMKISRNKDLASEIVKVVKEKVDLPVIVKLSPEAPNILELAQNLLKSGADGITATHRFQGLIFDIDTAEPLLDGSNGIGGPWVKPLTIHTISNLYQHIDLPIIGGNGIGKWEDAVEMILAGSYAIQLSTSVMMRGYKIIDEFISELRNYLRKHHYNSYTSLIGKGTLNLKRQNNVNFPNINLFVDDDICKSCIEKPCKDACFFGALTIKDDYPVINRLCNSCSLCVSACPFEAIKVI